MVYKSVKISLYLMLTFALICGMFFATSGFSLVSGNMALAASGTYKITYTEVGAVDAIKQYNGTTETTITEIVETSYTAETGKVYLYNLEKAGYTFDGWFENNTLNKINSKEEAPSGAFYYYINSSRQEDITVFPEFSATPYDIIYHNIEGITERNPNPSTYTTDKSWKLEKVTKLGYDFLGWYTDEGFNQKLINNTIEEGSMGEINLYAKFQIQTCVITYNYGDYEEVSLQYNDTITESMLPTPQREGYIFDGWWTTAGYTTKVNAGDPIKKNMHLHAKWIKIENPLWKWFTFGGMGLVVVFTCAWFIVFNRNKAGLE